MKKVCFIFVIFAALFLTVACDKNNKSTTNELNDEDAVDTADDTDAADSDKADSDKTDSADSSDTTDSGDTTNDGDPADSSDTENDGDTTDSGDTTNDGDTADTGDTTNDGDADDSGDTVNDGDVDDTGDEENDEDTVTETDPCNPNLCLADEHSDGICTVEEGDTYSCGCVSGMLGNYMWYEGQCRLVVTKTFCRQLAEDVQDYLEIPDWVTDVVEFVCYCFTESECVITIDL